MGFFSSIKKVFKKVADPIIDISAKVTKKTIPIAAVILPFTPLAPFAPIAIAGAAAIKARASKKAARQFAATTGTLNTFTQDEQALQTSIKSLRSQITPLDPLETGVLPSGIRGQTAINSRINFQQFDPDDPRNQPRGELVDRRTQDRLAGEQLEPPEPILGGLGADLGSKLAIGIVVAIVAAMVLGRGRA